MLRLEEKLLYTVHVKATLPQYNTKKFMLDIWVDYFGIDINI